MCVCEFSLHYNGVLVFLHSAFHFELVVSFVFALFQYFMLIFDLSAGIENIGIIKWLIDSSDYDVIKMVSYSGCFVLWKQEIGVHVIV